MSLLKRLTMFCLRNGHLWREEQQRRVCLHCGRIDLKATDGHSLYWVKL